MLPFLKKKSDAAAAPSVPAWHPNFRNYEKLPDIKVVRTAFFVNGAATVQVNDWQRQIDRDKKASDASIALFKKFQAEEAKVLEVDTFVKSKPSFSTIIIRLGQTLPPNIAIDSIDLREAGMSMRISIKGTSIAASQSASNFLDVLKADPEMTARFDKFEFTSTPTRNPNTGRMAVEILLSIKGAKK
jgi:hypothetical protein